MRGVGLRSVARRPSGPRLVAAAVLICAAAAAAGTGLRVAAVSSGPVRALALAESRTTVEAVITGDPRVVAGARRDTVVVPVRAELVRFRGELVRVRVPVLVLAGGPAWAAVEPGLRVRFTARLGPPRRGGLLAAVAFVPGAPVTVARPAAPHRMAARVRERLRTATDGLPADQRAVLPGMVLGDTSRLDQELAEKFRTAGLTHLMVVSGANLAIVSGAVLAGCGRLRVGPRGAPALAAIAVVAFVVVAHPEPSVLRAAVMGLIGLIALGTGRERLGLPALSAAVLLLVLADPGLARSYSFALSVLATTGLLVLAPYWRERLRRRLPAVLADAVAVAAAAQVAVSPVLVLLSGRVGIVAVPANLIAAPAVPVATLAGVVTAVVALVSMPVARLLAWPAGLAVGWVTTVARTAAEVPYASVPWPGGVTGAVVLAVVLAVGFVVLRGRRNRRVLLAAAVGTAVIVVPVRLAAPGWPPSGWLLTVCDVGQGDALVLAAGGSGRAAITRRDRADRAVVVDAGPDPVLVDGCLDRLGIRSVPLLVLTHAHADHTAGLPGVRDGRRIGTLLTGTTGTGTTGGTGTAASTGSTGRFGATHPAVAGQEWTVGDLTLSVLAPDSAAQRPADAGGDGKSVNNASVVLVARWPGLSALLTGDIETEVQQSLAAVVPRVDVLKTPHHGSRRFAPDFLAAAGAKVSITSVGADNDYGHPAPALVTEVQRLGARHYRTDRSGDIAVVRSGGRTAVVTRGAANRQR